VKYEVVIYRRKQNSKEEKLGLFNIDTYNNEIETVVCNYRIIADSDKKQLLNCLEELKYHLSLISPNKIIKGGSIKCCLDYEFEGKIDFNIYFTLISQESNDKPIEEINLKKEINYYDLVEIKNLHTHQVFHIPALFFPQEFLDTLSYSHKKRGEEFFSCPVCGDKSFFSGICFLCGHDDNVFVKKNVDEYKKYEPQKRHFKNRFLKMVLSGREIPKRFKVLYVRSA